MMNLQQKLLPWLQGPLGQLRQAKGSERLGHAWLIGGPVGTGKLNLALNFVTELLSTNPASEKPSLSPAEFAEAMRSRYEPGDHHPDLHIVFPEEGKHTIAVEQIRTATQSLNLTAHASGAKAVVIEPAERMTTAAANALLKSLEEPTPDTYLVLVAHRIGALPATILSRCQKLVIRRPDPGTLQRWIREGSNEALWTDNPLRLAEYQDYYNLYNKLENNIKDISRYKSDPVGVAAGWDRDDLELILERLIEHLQTAIRCKFGRDVKNGVTDRETPLSENLSHVLSTRALFQQLDRAQTLLGQLGSGTNETLAAQVLLLGFVPETRR